MQDITSHISTVIGTEPMDFDVAITSIGITGAPGFLNSLVLNAYGYPLSILEEISLSKGYYLLESKEKKPILFIVTVGRGNVSKNLNKNLRTALNVHLDDLKGKRIWVPLMATGAGEMSFEESYEIISSILRDFNYCDFTIAIPDNIRANNFVETYKIKLYNFIPQNIKAKAQKVQSKPIKEDYYSESVKESFESQSSGFATASNAPYEEEPIEKPKEEEKESLGSDKIPFHLDQVVDEDKLGRDPVAKAFVDLIKKDVFTNTLKHSFIVHLQGEWGTGKSSFMNLIRNHLNSEDEHWVIVDYNAWQNQHIKPPWWTLIDQIYRKSKYQLNWTSRKKLELRESYRRIWRYSGWDKILTFIVFALGVFGIIYFGDVILDIFKETTEVADNDIDVSKKSTISRISDFGKFILTLSSIIGTLYALAKILTTPFFINSTKEVESFVLKAADPMNKIKRHYSDLVDNINTEKRQLAIFIDDIDRCNKEFIVNLLEGIQTLFKEKRVLFIVAGDKNWITTSFGNIYKDFAPEESKKQQLGEFFLEKAFQLSFRMPNVSERSKELYWNHILGIDDDEEHTKKSLSDLSSEEQNVIKDRLSKTSENITAPEFMKAIEKEYNITGDTASNLIIEEKNKDSDEIKHLLKDYYKFIDSNPRSIIRLANNYTMTRSVLIAERTDFDEHKVFRWLIIEDLCPKANSALASTFDIETIKLILKEIKDNDKKDKCLRLLFDSDNELAEPLTIEDIKIIKGL